jgi:hypothetical protein
MRTHSWPATMTPSRACRVDRHGRGFDAGYDGLGNLEGSARKLFMGKVTVEHCEKSVLLVSNSTSRCAVVYGLGEVRDAIQPKIPNADTTYGKMPYKVSLAE